MTEKHHASKADGGEVGPTARQIIAEYFDAQDIYPPASIAALHILDRLQAAGFRVIAPGGCGHPECLILVSSLAALLRQRVTPPASEVKEATPNGTE